jgi:hypothetical protein
MDSASDEPVDAGCLQPAVGDPEGKDDAACVHGRLAGKPDLDHPVRSGERREGSSADQELGAEPPRLAIGAGRELTPADPVWKAWVVLDLGARPCLAAWDVHLDD